MRKIGADRKEWDKDNSLKAMESSLILDAFMSPQKTETENGDHFSSRSVHYPRGDTVSQITVPPDPACWSKLQKWATNNNTPATIDVSFVSKLRNNRWSIIYLRTQVLLFDIVVLGIQCFSPIFVSNCCPSLCFLTRAIHGEYWC